MGLFDRMNRRFGPAAITKRISSALRTDAGPSRTAAAGPSPAEQLRTIVGDGRVTAAAINQVMHGKTKRQRKDAWQNILTMVGTKNDKRSAGEFKLDPVSDDEARDLWRGDDIAKRVIETRPRQAMKRGWVFKMEDKTKAENVMASLEDLKVNRVFVRAGQYEAAYGGSAIFPILNDGSSDLTNPLDETAIHGVRSLQLFEPRELRPIAWYEDPQEPKWGEPEVYAVQPFSTPGGSIAGSLEIHESRLVIFPGIRVSRAQPVGCRLGWGDSRLTVMRNVLRDYNLSWDAAVLLMTEMSVGVFKMEGLAQLLEDDRDDEVAARMMQIDIGKSVANSITIGEKDSYERVSPQFNGVDSVLGKFETRLASAADMQVTMMLGQSPAGMDATGESDITIDDDRTETYRDEHMPQLEQIVKMCGILPNDGALSGNEPKRWSCEYNPLRQPSAKEEADRRLVVAEADHIYITDKVVSADDVAKSRYGGDTYSSDTSVDWVARKSQQEADAKAAEDLAARIAAAPPVDPNAPVAPATSDGSKPAVAAVPEVADTPDGAAAA